MAWPFSSTNHGHSSIFLSLALALLLLASQSCYGFKTFGFDIHHRFSDPVKGILGIDKLPKKGSPQYYVAMAQRDRVFRGRHLVGDQHTRLTFASGNDTIQISHFGFLHFANVSVGTPPLSFLVALDTGSDVFWLPCNCTSCMHGLKSPSGKIDFNIYELYESSTSINVSCSSSLCEQGQCSSSGSSCHYQVDYLSSNTSSAGFLVEDVLHLIMDDDQTKDFDARVTFGCGQVQTGAFLAGAAPNGLFGLGLDNISVPSILAKEGLTSNSFSMCFGSNGDGVGRITFGDNGSSDQGETPFNIRKLHPSYNITITQIIVGENVADLEFHAIFDSGTSYTLLNDPAYKVITEKFNSLINASRHSSQPSNSDLPFEYCYDIRPEQTIEVPFLNLTMKGGDNYHVTQPIVEVLADEGGFICLGIVKTDIVNIIGQNFMTGYKIVFDRENMNLGWKESNCYDDALSNMFNPSHSPAVSPAIAVNPVATSNPSSNLSRPPPNESIIIKPTLAFLVVLIFSLVAIF